MREIDIGDIAESNFISRCISLGYICCVPQNSNTIYDLILDSKSRIYKVQVKCTSKVTSDGRYRVCIKRGRNLKVGYESGDVDLFAVYILPEDEWYLLPYDEFSDVTYIRPKHGGKFDAYRDMFHLL